MAKKILIVDDSRTARQQVRMALSDAGYEVIEAVDGEDGLAKMAGNGDTALVICDVNMPNMDGLTMLASFEKTFARVPIVMLTTEAQPELLQQAKRLGAKGWIVKPFRAELLVAAVSRLAGG